MLTKHYLKEPVMNTQEVIWYTAGHSDWEQAEKLI